MNLILSIYRIYLIFGSLEINRLIMSIKDINKEEWAVLKYSNYEQSI